MYILENSFQKRVGDTHSSVLITCETRVVVVCPNFSEVVDLLVDSDRFRTLVDQNAKDHHDHQHLVDDIRPLFEKYLG